MERTNKIPLPSLKGDDSFDALVKQFARYLVKVVDRPITFEEFRKSQSHVLTPLSRYLVADVHHPALVAALMALRGHFAATEDEGDEGVNAGRATASEVVALRYTGHLSEREAIDTLLYELPSTRRASAATLLNGGALTATNSIEPPSDERTPLFSAGHTRENGSRSDLGLDGMRSPADHTDQPESADVNLSESLQGLNALEIAAVSGAKKFLSQRPIQRIITAIWDGDIIFWSSLHSGSTKQVQIYRKHGADPYSRLRVPRYLKVFEILFFLTFLACYYVVLVQKSFYRVTTAEILLYVWLASFGYNELGEFWDAGAAFYMSDFWTLWDVGIVLIGVAFFVCRMVGLANGDARTIDTAFDILSTEALVLIPRLCSLLSLHPYFGTLLPCLKEMTKDFIKFLSLIVILYLGFLTTFSLLARGHFTFRQMSWILIKVFFGSSYLGFDVAEENLIPLVLRPLRLFVPADKLRSVRIALLKATHFPFVGAIMLYENLRSRVASRHVSGLPLASTGTPAERSQVRRRYPRSNRLSTPQPLAAAILKRDLMEHAMPESTQQRAHDGNNAANDLADMQKAMARLTRQMEALTQRLEEQERRT
ncbi:hypothetical protein MBLNU457_1270t2 [Dothideomycetes sp. NU457]